MTQIAEDAPRQRRHGRVDWRTSFLRRVQYFMDGISDPQFARHSELTPGVKECLAGPAVDILLAAVLRQMDHNDKDFFKDLAAKFGREKINQWRSDYGVRYRSIGFNDLIQLGQVELDAWNQDRNARSTVDQDDDWDVKATRNSDFMARKLRPSPRPGARPAPQSRSAPAQETPRDFKPVDQASPLSGRVADRIGSEDELGLWYVYIEDEKENYSLFVTAATPRRAGEIWAEHYGFRLDDLPAQQLAGLKAARVPGAAGEERAHEWSDEAPGVSVLPSKNSSCGMSL